jgi:hypothetical protein
MEGENFKASAAKKSAANRETIGNELASATQSARNRQVIRVAKRLARLMRREMVMLMLFSG